MPAPKRDGDRGAASFEIREVGSAHELGTVRRLFREYERSLTTSLCFQDFATELRSLPGAYALPSGTLLLASVDGRAAGCAGLREGPAGAGEMKRLFVRPEYRRTGLGRALVERIVACARTSGYAALVLDTLPEMTVAQRLYRELGFRETEPYGDRAVPGIRYFRLDLTASR